jgi:hypothetical protein
MAYEKRPGDLAVFKNDRKEKETHPDYTITGLTLDGRPMKGALWLKEGRDGKKFMAGKIEVDEYAENKSKGGGGGSAGFSGPAGRADLRDSYEPDDSIPFIRW